MMNDVLNFAKSIFNRFGVEYFFGQPADTITLWFLLGGFITLFVFTISLYIYLRIKAKKLKPYFSYAKTFFWYNFTFIILGLINLFGRYENLTFISWRFWMYVVLATILAFNGWFFSKRKQELEDELDKYADKKRKEKWLKK